MHYRYENGEGKAAVTSYCMKDSDRSFLCPQSPCRGSPSCRGRERRFPSFNRGNSQTYFSGGLCSVDACHAGRREVDIFPNALPAIFLSTIFRYVIRRLSSSRWPALYVVSAYFCGIGATFRCCECRELLCWCALIFASLFGWHFILKCFHSFTNIALNLIISLCTSSLYSSVCSARLYARKAIPRYKHTDTWLGRHTAPPNRRSSL